jgi:hypothetical protein
MRVHLDLLLDCPADAAWEALHSPAVFRAVSGPWTTAASLEEGGFPERWPGGDHRVRLRLLGVLPMGEQVIRLRDDTVDDAVLGASARVVHDEGGPVRGPMTLVRHWHHRMAIAPNPLSGTPERREPRTRFTDTLEVRAGLLTPLVWLGFRVFWGLRARKLVRLAPGWAAQFGVAPAAGVAA